MPLWGNPLLQLEYSSDERTVQWQEQGMQGLAANQLQQWRGEQAGGFQTWLGTPGLYTVGDLQRLRQRLLSVRVKWLGAARQRRDCRRLWEGQDTEYGGGWARQVVRQVWGVEAVCLPPVVRQLVRVWRPWVDNGVDGMQLWDVVQAMWAIIPRDWREASAGVPVPAGAGAGVLDPSQCRLLCAVVQPVVEELVARLGWGEFLLTGWPKGRGEAGPWHLSVRAATRRQLRPLFAAQAAAKELYVVDASVAVGAPKLEAGAVRKRREGLECGMRWVWRMQWENRWKEALWRLVVNGVPGAGGHDVDQRGPCPCGWTGPGLQDTGLRCREWRWHHFWGCPVAHGVVQQVQRALPQQQPPRPLRRAQLWLLRPPPLVQGCVWEVVCTAAIEAMWYGRRLMWSLEFAAREQGRQAPPGQTLITDFLPVVSGVAPPPPLTAAERAAAQAGARFWEVLESLVALGRVPRDDRWLSVAADHPFLGVQPAPTADNLARKRLVLNLPPAPS